MSKKDIIIRVSVILGIIGIMFFVWWRLSNISSNDLSIAERVTIYLQVLAGSVTFCISCWGLTIAHRKMKHWELEQCQELSKTYCAHMDIRDKILEKWNNDPSAFSSFEYYNLSNTIFNFWEEMALKEQKSYLDKDILYDLFILALINDLEDGLFDKYQQKHEKDKFAYCHTRKLYLKWKKRLKKEQNEKYLSDDWNKTQEFIKQARENDPELAEKARINIAFIEHLFLKNNKGKS